MSNNNSIFIDGFELPQGWEDFWAKNRQRLGGSKVRFISNLIEREMRENENGFRNPKFKGL